MSTLQKISLQWRDKTVDKSIDELLDRAAVVAAAPETPQRSATPAAAPPPPAPSGAPQFGVEIGAPGNSVRACRPDDASPAGTVLEGYKKSIEKTPFGDACRWLQNK